MAIKHPRNYTPEFREQAIQLAKQLGSARASAEKLGIPEATVGGWCTRKKKGKLLSGAKIASAAGETPEEELKRLRKENDELKKVNYILKRAAAFFSQDHLK